MKESLDKLFQFLIENRSYNKEVQTQYYTSIINGQKSNIDNIVSLLYHIANTQSQPRIDKLSEFYKKIYHKPDLMNSFKGFMSIINPNGDNNYKGLFKGMVEQSGWGEKTSALLVKSLFHLHNNDYPIDLKIWTDAPTTIEDDDQLFLPVDTVILAIFQELENKGWDFKNINKEIKAHYTNNNEIEIWDDLWFWGFITQTGTGDNRKMEWNLNKYWTLRETNKNPEIISEIKGKAIEFLTIINEAKTLKTSYKN